MPPPSPVWRGGISPAASCAASSRSGAIVEPAIEAALAELEASGVIDDARYGDNLVAASGPSRPGPGPHPQRTATRSGLSAEAIQTTMDQAKQDGPDFLALARAARTRKFGAELPKDWQRTRAAGQIFAIPGLFNGSYPRCFGGGPR